MQSGLHLAGGLFARLLPESSFPRTDHRRRIRASFVLALAALQASGSAVFALTEMLAAHWTMAGLMGFGAVLPLWPGLRMRRDGNVDRWSQFFVANMFVLLGAILVASGGRSLGVVMALPALLLVSSLVSSARQIVFWGLLVMALLMLGSHLRDLPGPWPIEIDPQWAQAAIGRVPLILAVCLLAASAMLRSLLDSIFVDLAEARRNELEAIERARFDQQRFTDFADIAADWFWETDAELRLIYVSPGMTTHTGLAAERAIGKHPVGLAREHFPDSAELTEVEARMSRHEPFVSERMGWRDETTGRLAIFRNLGRPRYDASGSFLGYRGAVTNITETWQLTRELKRQARTDPLTGLLNRRAFGELLSAALAQVRDGSRAWWLLQLDLDHFKAVNDHAGHAVGDEILLRTAALLRDSGLPAEQLARIGGDEFCALVPAASLDSVTSSAARIIAGFALLAAEFGQRIGASIGIVQVGAESDESRQLQAADEACYRAKREGRGRIVVA